MVAVVGMTYPYTIRVRIDTNLLLLLALSSCLVIIDNTGLSP